MKHKKDYSDFRREDYPTEQDFNNARDNFIKRDIMRIKKEIKQYKKEIDERKKQLDAADSSEKEMRESADYPCKNCSDAFNCPFADFSIDMRERLCRQFLEMKINNAKKRERDAINHTALKDAPELLKRLHKHRLN